MAEGGPFMAESILLPGSALRVTIELTPRLPFVSRVLRFPRGGTRTTDCTTVTDSTIGTAAFYSAFGTMHLSLSLVCALYKADQNSYVN